MRNGVVVGFAWVNLGARGGRLVHLGLHGFTWAILQVFGFIRVRVGLIPVRVGSLGQA